MSPLRQISMMDPGLQRSPELQRVEEQKNANWPEYSDSQRLDAMKVALQDLMHLASSSTQPSAGGYGGSVQFTPGGQQTSASKEAIPASAALRGLSPMRPTRAPNIAAAVPPGIGQVVVHTTSVVQGVVPAVTPVLPQAAWIPSTPSAQTRPVSPRPPARALLASRMESPLARCRSPLRVSSVVTPVMASTVQVPSFSPAAEAAKQRQMASTQALPSFDMLGPTAPVTRVDTARSTFISNDYVSLGTTYGPPPTMSRLDSAQITGISQASGSSQPDQLDCSGNASDAVKAKVSKIQVKMLQLLQGPEDLARCLKEAGMDESEVERLLQTKDGVKEAMRWISGLCDGTSSLDLRNGLNSSATSSSSTCTGGSGRDAVQFANGKRAGPEDLARFLMEAGMPDEDIVRLLSTKDGIKEAARFIIAWVKSGAPPNIVQNISEADADAQLTKVFAAISQVITTVAIEHSRVGVRASNRMVDLLDSVGQDVHFMLTVGPTRAPAEQLPRLLENLEALLREVGAADAVQVGQQMMPMEICDAVRRVHDELQGEMTRLETLQSIQAIQLSSTLGGGFPNQQQQESWASIEEQMQCIEALYADVVNVQHKMANSTLRSPSWTPKAHSPSYTPAIGRASHSPSYTPSNGSHASFTPVSMSPVDYLPPNFNSLASARRASGASDHRRLSLR